MMDRRDVDELIILDIAATPDGRGPRFAEVKHLCENLFMPVTVGGGVRTCEDIRSLLRAGADKVAINTMAVEHPSYVALAAKDFGSQAITVSIDILAGRVVSGCGRKSTGRKPAEWAEEVASHGAGEILLTSVDRDGTMQGYDLELIQSVSQAVDIPVIAAGGCGTYRHMQEAFEAGAHAVASGAMFQFCEATPKGAARYLNEHEIPVRL
jgi:cyclase